MVLIRVVMFDLGGVVFPSPFPQLALVEKRAGAPPNTITQVIKQTGDSGAWAKLERGEIDPVAFDAMFYQECLALSGEKISGAWIIDSLTQHSFDAAIHPLMEAVIQRLRGEHGLVTVALTNNWTGSLSDSTVARLNSLFDLVIQSCQVRARKPEPLIYQLALQKIREEIAGCQEIEASQVVFLDDIGSNLKPAKALGMHTIHVALDQPLESSLQPLVQLIPNFKLFISKL